jgi:hypothetical protein
MVGLLDLTGFNWILARERAVLGFRTCLQSVHATKDEVFCCWSMCVCVCVYDLSLQDDRAVTSRNFHVLLANLTTPAISLRVVVLRAIHSRNGWRPMQMSRVLKSTTRQCKCQAESEFLIVWRTSILIQEID